MIQSISNTFKTFFNSNPINPNNITAADFQKYELLCLNSLNKSKFHKNNSICKANNFMYVQSYQRNFVVFNNNQVIDSKVDIPVLFCNNCRHYHALLPNYFIAPYCQYSIGFILGVLIDKFYSTLTVEAIAEKYKISVSTIYRWKNKYKYILVIYRHLKDKYLMSFFIAAKYLYEDLIDDFFDVTATTLFEKEHKLFKP